ncbi:MAG: 50S ribosomal protein L33 [Deltaproteobacteria bacterium]|nr:50S ribosomal protein L33 [Deltaproteobacteria bacterium]
MGTRVRVVLACEVCGSRNYKTQRTGRPGARPLKLKKYCPACKTHTVHHESK